MKVENGKITDENGNVATIAYWGSEDAARASLATLVNCSYCSDCSYCSNCSYCSDCSYCSNCSYCSYCRNKKENKGSKNQHVPVIKNIHKTVYAVASQPSALDMSDWHTCDTTHCRAGWIITLAGNEGAVLENYWGTDHAAWLIYKASDPNMDGRPNFYASNEDALEDMKRLAEMEATQ